MRRTMPYRSVCWAASLVGVFSAWASADVVCVGGREFLRIERRANCFTASAQSQVAIDMDAAGNFLVAWDSRRQEGGNYGVYARWFDAVGRPIGGEFRISQFTANAQRFPGVSLAAGGGPAYLVWESFGQDGRGWGVYGRSLGLDGVVGEPEIAIGRTGLGSQTEAAAACTSEGRAIVTWSGQVETAAGSVARRVFVCLIGSDGRASTGEIPVAADLTGDQHGPCPAANGRGRCVVVWTQATGSVGKTRILAQRFDADGRLIGRRIPVSPASGGHLEPSVAADGGGRFVAAWHSACGEGYNLQVRCFGADGSPLGRSFAVGEQHAGRQSGAQVAVGLAGELVVAWNHLAADGSIEGVYAQLFERSWEQPAGAVFRVTRAESGVQRLAAATGRQRVVFGPQGQLAFAWSGDGGLGDPCGAYVTLLLPIVGASAGDVMGDAALTSAELAAFADLLAGGEASVRAWVRADLNRDGLVSFADLVPFGRAIARSTGAGTPPTEVTERLAAALASRWAGGLARHCGQAWSMAARRAGEVRSAVPHQPPTYQEVAPLDPFGGDPSPFAGRADYGFLGITHTGWIPPDPHLAVGPDHIVLIVNGAIAFFEKDGTRTFQQSISGSDGFWGEQGATTFVFDPEVIYDPHSDRFMAVASERTQPDGSGLSYFLLAISDDAGPDGAWHKYRLEVTGLGGGGDIDSPNIGVDEQVIYLTADFFTGGKKCLVYMLEKAPMLSGGMGLTRDLLITGAQSHGLPVIHGEAPAMYLIQHFGGSSNTLVRLHAITDPLGSPARVSYDLTVPVYGRPEDPPQAGTTLRSETFDARFWSCLWRDGSLWATHHINPDRVLVRWYEIETNGWPESGSLPGLRQWGEIDPGSPVRTFFGAISADAQGNAGIVLARSAPDEYISMGRAVRAASDPPGTFRPMVINTESLAPWTSIRWGDYGGIGVGPVDDRTFWAHHEYATSGSSWNTWVVTFGAYGPPGDLDRDGDVDLSDFATFALCYYGSGVTVPPADCLTEDFAVSDLDRDGDVDLDDFSTLANNFTGYPPRSR